MNKTFAMRVQGSIAILLLLSISVPVQSASGLQQLVPAVVRLADGDPYFLGELNGELYYKYQSQLWKADGTASGALPLTSAVPLGPHKGTVPYFPFKPKHYPKGGASSGLFFFSADDGVHGQELWRSNGTPAGTSRLTDIAGSGSPNPEDFIDMNGVLFFKTTDVCYPVCDLWRTDGTPEGTFPVKAIDISSTNTELRASSINGMFLFQSGDELWKSDGTVAGTALIKSGIGFLAATEQNVYFRATSDGSLWATDGIGTVQLTGFPFVLYACVSGACYFSEETLSGRAGLWKTDGTPTGTLKLADLSPDSAPSPQFADVNGLVYFAVSEGGPGYELWKTDGTPGGTVFVRDNLAGVSGLTSAFGQLYFIAHEGSGFDQLWKSNGTAAGTGVVTNVGSSQSVTDIVMVNGRMLLKVGEPFPLWEYITYQTWHLYRSDGTQTGTVKVANADFARKVIHCGTPLCEAGVLYQEQSMVIDGKWYFGDSDVITHNPAFWVVEYIYFGDVLPDYWAFPWVERLADAEMSAGCGIDMYCPEDHVTRAQIAVFIERGIHGSGFVPPNVSPTFNDTAGHWAADWIEAVKADGITSGCGNDNYCPDASTTRAEMAIFLLRAEHGASYSPPAATGTEFTDVPSSYWAAAWIEQLANEGITGGCGSGNYCPDAPVTRAQMAVFLVRTFNLP